MADSSNTSINANPPAPGLQLAGDYAIQTLALVTSDGTAIDITTQAVEINLYEDLFAPCMTGTILMGDAQDLVTNFKMNGNEWLILSIDKPGLNKPIKKVFRVYKISQREFKTASMQNYLLHFCSEELIISTQQYVSKAYNGMLISTMIQDVLTNKLGVQNTKINFFDSTTGIFNIVVPRQHPFECIEWLSSRAYSSNGSIFFFYENRYGYNFMSYEHMLALPVYKTYTYGVKLETDPVSTNYSLNFLSIDKDFDIIETGEYGGYASTLLMFDLVNRSLQSSTINASQFPLINNNIPVNLALNRFNVPLIAADYLIKFYPMTDSDPNTNKSQPQSWLHVKALRLAQLFSYKMVGTVPGDVLLTVGSTINVELPTSQVKSNYSQGGDQINKLRSGRYLVTALHHKFFNDLSTTAMELVSDSVVSELNASNDSSAALQTIKKS